MFINGRWIEARDDKKFSVLNPANGNVIGKVPDGGETEATMAVAAAYETFGPVAPIIYYEDENDLLEMANDTDYGLAAYVYTKAYSTAMKFFEGLNFGIIGINDINPTSAAAPFGGMKMSGIGREGSIEGIEEYLETKSGGFSLNI